ncbi:cellulose synthase operon protein YhjQ/BcsQ [Succinivibrio dextrinosolvens]|uniref:cellulose synthase operon protein YhjQ/BcsQ n=1 Tax=Succinivibrio dextrinosolvens TaxID=83771 RepID=UPI0024795C33|nr:cellulose synthase operon protein YhjQ/BcsQ [Succinivibrio dextrinosolvens]
MYWICLQGLTGFIGTSSIASALGYSFSKNGWNSLCVDGYHDYLAKRSSSTNILYNLESNTKGWFDNLCCQDSELNLLKFADKCYYLPFGNSSEHYDEKKALEYIRQLKAKISQYSKLDYIIVDAGVKNSVFASAMEKESDVIITLMEAEGNCISIFEEQEIKDNEYLVLNKFVLNSTVMNEVEMMIRNSDYGRNFLKTSIKYDESVMQSFLHQMPVTRYMPISVASNDIEKLMFDIVFISSNTDESEK